MPVVLSSSSPWFVRSYWNHTSLGLDASTVSGDSDGALPPAISMSPAIAPPRMATPCRPRPSMVPISEPDAAGAVSAGQLDDAERRALRVGEHGEAARRDVHRRREDGATDPDDLLDGGIAVVDREVESG